MENDLKKICDIIPCSDQGDVNDQAKAITYALAGVQIDYNIGGGEQPEPFPPTVSSSTNKVTFSRNSQNGGFDISTSGSIDGNPVSSPYFIRPSDDGKILTIFTTGTNFKTISQTVTLTYVEPITGSTFNFTYNGTPDISLEQGGYTGWVITLATLNGSTNQLSYWSTYVNNQGSNYGISSNYNAFGILYIDTVNNVSYVPYTLNLNYYNTNNASDKATLYAKNSTHKCLMAIGVNKTTELSQSKMDSFMNGESVATFWYYPGANWFDGSLDGSTVGTWTSENGYNGNIKAEYQSNHAYYLYSDNDSNISNCLYNNKRMFFNITMNLTWSHS